MKEERKISHFLPSFIYLFFEALVPKIPRLMAMSSMLATGTHNERVKKLALFFAIISGIMMESQLSTPLECSQFLDRIENSITFIP